MYLVTHALVLAFFLIWLMLSLFSPEKITKIKKDFCTLLFKILNKEIVISGLNNIESGKHYIIVANYPSGYAGFVMMLLFPEASILVHGFMSKVPVLSSLLKRSGFIYARRRGYKEIRNVIREMLRTVQAGSLIILPEGKPTSDGRIHEFKRGFIHIVRNSSLDLLPITLNGFNKLKPFFNRFYLDPDTQLEVIIHKPIVQPIIKSMSDEKLSKKVMNIIKSDYRP